MFTPALHPLALATAFAEAHETPWTRDPLREPQRFGVHHDAYFSPSWTAFQADGGRDFSVIVDGVSV